MNPDLQRLHPYPFERLRQLYASVTPSADHSFISLSIGEPKHAAPAVVLEALAKANHGLANYPIARGTPGLRGAINAWLMKRYSIPPLDVERQIVPVSGTREALFAIAQTVVDRTKRDPLVVCPNPFYQIYEGAALLAGATPIYANIDAKRGAVHYHSITDDEWARVQLLYACSPGNPTGAVMNLDDWRELFELSDRHGFTIVSDECYSEIYFDEPPLGGLEAAHLLGRHDYRRLMVFSSLSKRSNVPGMRSGFVAGDTELMDGFTLYRTYHGAALSPVFQEASIAAWQDEIARDSDNRRLYQAKFKRVTPMLASVFDASMPEAAFYLWIKTPIADEEFARRLFAAYNVAVLPGSYLGRTSHGFNPGDHHVRVALVADEAECVEAAERMIAFGATL